MTDNIEWGEPLTGPEIKALGLPGDTPVSADNMPLPLRDWALLSDTPFYRLPADHPAYTVHRYNKEHGTAPVNHGPAADDKREVGEFIPCERTVWMCIDALPTGLPFDSDEMDHGWDEHLRSSRDALEALLPKPDRAEELVKVFRDEVSFLEWKWTIDEILKQFGDWLIERGEIKG